MDTQKLFMLKSHFNLVDKGFLSDFVYATMFRFGNSFWVLVCTFMLNLSGFIIKYISRFQADGDCHKNESKTGVVPSQTDDQIVSNSSMDSDSDWLTGKENSEFSFGFQFQTSKDAIKSIIETGSSALMESGSIAGTNKYQFMSAEGVSGFMEEPQRMSFTVQEMFLASNEGLIMNGQIIESEVQADKDFQGFNLEEKVQSFHEDTNYSSSENDQIIDTKVSTSEDLPKLISEAEVVDQEKTEYPVLSSCSEEVFEEEEQIQSTFSDKENLSYGVQLFPPGPNPGFDCLSDSGTNDFWSNRCGKEGLESDTCMFIDESKEKFTEKFWTLEKIDIGDTSSLESEEVVSRDNSDDSDDEYIELDSHLQDSSELIKESLSWKISDKVGDLPELESTHREGMEPMDDLGKSGKHSSRVSDSDEEDGPDILLEHLQLVEQMKMELKNARNRGLPTILEESETLKTLEDLKPLKIDEKLEHKDRMGEIQKFCKSYSGKMRKLDILNYQTMHAISFLQLKDRGQLTSSKKSTVSAIKSLLLPNFWPCKLRRIYADPKLKSISELYRDLEVVYVGQLCLSWEILHWQYGKAKELQEYDSQGCHSYNQVAGEFQQFQVLVQRFIEDEPFQGPRVQNYVNNCILRSLLQVPTIKDDCVKDKKGRIEEEKDAISIAMLAEKIEEAMMVYWEFLRADKDHADLMLKGLEVDLQDPADSELLMDIKTSLQKKEKRLKDNLRTRNCIVKKFQKHQASRLNHAQFLSQVELRLVSRVLSLSRLTTDQLVWCQTKLNNINFVDRKIHVEPSFLLFPC